MDNNQRVEIYLRQIEKDKQIDKDGFLRLTPRQRKRAQKKYNRYFFKQPKEKQTTRI